MTSERHCRRDWNDSVKLSERLFTSITRRNIIHTQNIKLFESALRYTSVVQHQGDHSFGQSGIARESVGSQGKVGIAVTASVY